MENNDKLIDPERLCASLPDLASLEAVARTGVLSGCPFRLSWGGEWTATAAGFIRLDDIPRDDIVLDSSAGEIVIERPSVTKASSDGTIRGLSLSTCLRRAHPTGATTVRRTLIRADVDLWSRVCFPQRLVFPKTKGVATALLPLTLPGVVLDVFFLKEGPFLVIEERPTSGAPLELDRFREASGAAKILLTYLTGERFDADSCDVLADQNSDWIIEARWYQGRGLDRHIYHPIPTSWSESASAQRALKLDRANRNALDPQVLSRCLDYVLSNAALVAPLEYLIRFPEAPVEMRGAFLSVALESLTDHLEKAGILQGLTLLHPSTWEPLLQRLLEVASADWDKWDKDQRSAFGNRLRGLNRATNSQKLVQPFNVLGVSISSEQLAAIDRRNTLLHRGRLLDPDLVARDRDAWKKAYEIEMHLYSAINKLLLKRVGYSGPIIDWGRTSRETGEQVYELL
jgi:hypothetical protein